MSSDSLSFWCLTEFTFLCGRNRRYSSGCGGGGSVGQGVVLTWLGAARVSTDCRMWQERREGSAALPQGLAQNATPKCNTDRGSWSSQLCTCSAQDSDKFKRLLSSYMICLRLSQVPSLWFFLQGAPQGEGTFASNVSLNPPTQTPTAPWDWQKEKKKYGLYTNLRKCFKPSSPVCALWNVTRLCSIVIKKPKVVGEAGQKWTLRCFSSYSSPGWERVCFLFLGRLASVQFWWCHLEQHMRLTLVCPLRLFFAGQAPVLGLPMVPRTGWCCEQWISRWHPPFMSECRDSAFCQFPRQGIQATDAGKQRAPGVGES